MTKKYLNIFDLSLYPNATVFIISVKEYGKIVSINYELNTVTVKLSNGNKEVFHPSRIRLCLIDVQSIHKHISEESERIGKEEGEEIEMLYMIKKNVDVFGWIDKKLAVKKKRSFNKNCVVEQNN